MSNSFQTMERLVQRRTRHLQFAAKTGELNIVPYLDIMVNLIMFMLVTLTSSVSLSVLGVSAPRYTKRVTGGPVAPKTAELKLTVLVSLKGFYVSMRGAYVGSDGKVLPKGTPRPDAPTIPKIGDKYDFIRLGKLALQVKTANAKETRVVLVADYRVPYETVIKTMDALREQGGKTLFPDVFLGTL